MTTRAAIVACLFVVSAGAETTVTAARAQGLNASIGNVPIGDDARAMRALPQEEQLARAFEAAFDGTGARMKLDSGRTMVYEPGALAWAAWGAVLLSSGHVEGGGAEELGTLAVHYLTPEGTRFKVTGAYLDKIGGSLMGNAPQWVVSTDFGANPVIVTDSFGEWQGVSCTATVLYELAGGEPVPLGAFRSGYDNIGSVGKGPQAMSITGSIRNIIKGKSFEVHFDGTVHFKQTFARKGRKYVKTGGQGEVPEC